MNDFFLRHIDLLETFSVNADKRRYSACIDSGQLDMSQWQVN
ncbi:MAG: hypothetical protein VX344_04780 [Bacteroidota bacterium]|nr:hypothetical protein [Bacteroidota bacterium]